MKHSLTSADDETTARHPARPPARPSTNALPARQRVRTPGAMTSSTTPSPRALADLSGSVAAPCSRRAVPLRPSFESACEFDDDTSDPVQAWAEDGRGVSTAEIRNDDHCLSVEQTGRKPELIAAASSAPDLFMDDDSSEHLARGIIPVSTSSPIAASSFDSEARRVPRIEVENKNGTAQASHDGAKSRGEHRRHRPPPIVTPIGGGLGFPGSSDLLDGGKGVAIHDDHITPTPLSRQVSDLLARRFNSATEKLQGGSESKLPPSIAPAEYETATVWGGDAGSGEYHLTAGGEEESDGDRFRWFSDDFSKGVAEDRKDELRMRLEDTSRVHADRHIPPTDRLGGYAALTGRNVACPLPPQSSLQAGLASFAGATWQSSCSSLSPVIGISSLRGSGEFASRENSLLSNSSRGDRASEDDPYVFEEASQSSFGETSTRSELVRARNGILPADPHPRAKDLEQIADLADIGREQHFVFGRNGRFTDGGFVITADGLMQTPEKARMHGGDAPQSNFILVRSLDEFVRGPTLGSGAAARVYLASHASTNARMAVKEINVYDEAKRNQLLKELETLISHNNRYLVRSYGAFYDGDGCVHVTLEYMDRGALSDVVQRTGPVPEPVIRHIARNCLRGLSYLHSNRVIHRDLKTANILLSRRAGVAKLSDFGLARDLIPGASKADTFVGTLAYMSPERLHGSVYTYASDIWGLGISLLECVLGRYPFEKPQSYFDYVAAVRTKPWELAGGMASSAMLDFVEHCTKLEPGERSTVEELLVHKWMAGKEEDEDNDEEKEEEEGEEGEEEENGGFLSRRVAGSAEDDSLQFRSWLDSVPEIGDEATRAAADAARGGASAAVDKERAKAAKEIIKAKAARVTDSVH
jgi:Protein kinase domain